MPDEQNGVESSSLEGHKTTVDIFSPNVEPAKVDVPTFDSFVPEQFKQAPWVENLRKAENPQFELFKQYEEAQKLVGAKTLSAPTETSTPEEVAAWRKAVGVPEKFEDYKYNKPVFEGEDAKFGEYLSQNVDDAFLDKMKQEAHKLGMPGEMFSKLVESFDRNFVERAKEINGEAWQKQMQMDEDFEAMGNRLWGDKWPQVAAQGKQMFKDLVPPQLQPDVAELDNKSLMILTAAMNSFADKYMGEDTKFTGKGMSNVGMTPDEYREIGRKLMQDPAYSNPSYGARHEEAVRKVNEHYKINEYAKK